MVAVQPLVDQRQSEPLISIMYEKISNIRHDIVVCCLCFSSYDSEEGCDSNMQYVRGHIRCAVSCCRGGVVSRLSVERVVPVLPVEHKKVVSMSDKFWVWNF